MSARVSVSACAYVYVSARLSVSACVCVHVSACVCVSDLARGLAAHEEEIAVGLCDLYRGGRHVRQAGVRAHRSDGGNGSRGV